MAIQDKIDKANSDAGRNVLRCVIRDDSGPANVPLHMSVDFLNCTITSLMTAGDNRVNIENGTLAGGEISGTALIFRNAILTGQLLASNGSKIEYENLEVSGPTLLDNSSLFSKFCTYSGDLAWQVNNRSKLRSDQDVLSGGTVLSGSGVLSEATLVEPSITSTTLAILSNSAKLFLDGGTVAVTNAGSCSTGAAIEIRTCSNLSWTNSLSLDNYSRVVIRTMPIFTCVSGFTATNNSYVEVLGIETLTCNGDFLDLDQSRAEITRFDTFTCAGTLASMTTLCALRIANGETLTCSSDLGTAGAGTIITIDKITVLETDSLFALSGAQCTFVDLTELIVDGDDGFTGDTQASVTLTDLQSVVVANQLWSCSDSTLNAKGCQSIIANGTDAMIAGTSSGIVVITDCETFNSTGTGSLISTTGLFVVTLNNNTTTASTSAPVIVMVADGNASLQISLCQLIKSTGNSIAISVTGVDVEFDHLTTVQSAGLQTLYGRPSSKSCQEIKVNHCSINSFDIQKYSVWLFDVSFQDYLFDTSDVHLRWCAQSGSVGGGGGFSGGAKARKFLNCSAWDEFTTWEQDITWDDTVLHQIHSTPNGTLYPRNSVLQILHNDGANPDLDMSSSGGNTISISKWVPGSIKTSVGDDAISLFSLGDTPSYSGPGALFTMATVPCAVGNMDYISIMNNQITLLDNRNSYFVVSQDITRYSDAGSIVDTCLDGTYTLSAGEIDETSDGAVEISASGIVNIITPMTATITGSVQVIFVSGVSVLVAAPTLIEPDGV